MDEKRLYLLAQFDEGTQKTLSGLYDALHQHGFDGRQTKNIPYHITLGSYGAEQEERLLREMEAVCASADRIDIRMGHIGLFGLNVLFIEPNMNVELLHLHHRFLKTAGMAITLGPHMLPCSSMNRRLSIVRCPL